MIIKVSVKITTLTVTVTVTVLWVWGQRGLVLWENPLYLLQKCGSTTTYRVLSETKLSHCNWFGRKYKQLNDTIWNFYCGFLGFLFHFAVFLNKYVKFDIKNFTTNIFFDWLEKTILKKEEKIRKLLDKSQSNTAIILFNNN